MDMRAENLDMARDIQSPVLTDPIVQMQQITKGKLPKMSWKCTQRALCVYLAVLFD